MSSYKDLKQMSQLQQPNEVVKALGFDKSLGIVYEILNKDTWDEELQEYGALILEEVRNNYSEKWNLNWRYDALLGYAYDIILKYDERYEAYRRAMDKAKNPPPELLIAFARCCIGPGKPPITIDEAIAYVKEAIKDIQFAEGVLFLRGLYRLKNDKEMEAYWDQVLAKIKDNGHHLPPIFPETA